MSSFERKGILACGVGLLMLCVAVSPAPAQIPDEFTNLKVFPKDIGKQELIDVMRKFSGALGVRCNHCHVGEDPNSLEGYDFASDKPEAKRIARSMMNITQEINQKLMPTIGRKPHHRVRCVTCHRGLEEPEGLDEMLMEAMEEGGVDAATKRYRELRDEYYGKGTFDFSPRTLNSMAEQLAQEQQNVDGAIALTKLNVELSPDDAYSHLLLGQFYMSKGDKAAAVASIERSLELEPDNKWAKRMLERVHASE